MAIQSSSEMDARVCLLLDAEAKLLIRRAARIFCVEHLA
jgi:hypothetical protein